MEISQRRRLSLFQVTFLKPARRNESLYFLGFAKLEQDADEDNAVRPRRVEAFKSDKRKHLADDVVTQTQTESCDVVIVARDELVQAIKKLKVAPEDEKHILKLVDVLYHVAK